jgi:hypothetical protein
MYRSGASLILIIAAMLPGTTEACACPVDPLEELVPRLGVLFEGQVDNAPSRVVGSAPDGPRDLYRFTVGRVWKGDVGPNFVVAYPPLQGANCGLALKPGDKIVVGAYLVRDQPAQGNSCTYMNLNEPPRDITRALGAPKRDHRR